MICSTRLLCSSRSTVGRIYSAFLVALLPAAALAQFNYVVNNGAITITGYTGPGGDVTIPSTINGLPVLSIGIFAFYHNGSLLSVTIPDKRHQHRILCISRLHQPNTKRNVVNP